MFRIRALSTRLLRPSNGLITRARPAMMAPSIRRTTATAAAPPPSRKRIGALAATYDPAAVESQWYEWWERSGFFKPQPKSNSASDVFSVVLPPPNVTGALHIGHALTITVQDVLSRWQRMRGSDVVWIPGLDHAGIATQSVVERYLLQQPPVDAGITANTRHALGRERFLSHVWKWKAAYGGRIVDQCRSLGASLDWSREVFTLDDARSHAVRHAFIALYDAGLIYRSTRIVNWCSQLRTAVSDIEVDTTEVTTKTKLPIPGKPETIEFGAMYTIRYPVEAGGGELEVATTRPETMFGDVAVAIHPDDTRYTAMHGRYVIQPLTGRRLPIVLDSTLVDPKKGTGVVKITPAHDLNDYECAKRHSLPAIDILNDDGTLNAHAGTAFQGMDRLLARRHVLKALTAAGAFVRATPHAMTVARCSRSGDVIEPRLKPQWFVATKEMSRAACESVRSGALQLLPADAGHTETWYRWLENCEDWCISRQLWWGHRTPAFRIVTNPAANATATSSAPPSASNTAASSPIAGATVTSERWVVAHTLAEARTKAIARYPELQSTANWSLEQDEDVLDTWFSSGLFPLTVFGWPNVPSNSVAAAEFARYYPLSVLETGSDILFFWVARMVMLCTYLSTGNQLPFRRVYLHPVVRDKQGRKMSKSVGNVIDPMHVIAGVSLTGLHDAHIRFATGQSSPTATASTTADAKQPSPPAAAAQSRELKAALARLTTDYPNGIPACGTDALRFTLASYLTQSVAIHMDVGKVVTTRQFGNKIWQATRYVMQAAGGAGDAASDVASPPAAEASGGSDALANRWILDRYARTVQSVHDSLSAYDLGAATSHLYTFILNDFCDVFIEFSKPLTKPEAAPAVRARTQHVLRYVLDGTLRLLHPFMPYLSEELWQSIAVRSSGESIMRTAYPSPSDVTAAGYVNPTVVTRMQHVLDVVHTFRSIKMQFGAHIAQPFEVAVSVNSADAALHSDLAPEMASIRILCRVPDMQLQLTPSAPTSAGVLVETVNRSLRLAVRLKLSDALNADFEKFKEKVARLEASAARAREKLAAIDRARMPVAVYNEQVAALQRLETEWQTARTSVDGLRHALAK